MDRPLRLLSERTNRERMSSYVYYHVRMHLLQAIVMHMYVDNKKIFFIKNLNLFFITIVFVAIKIFINFYRNKKTQRAVRCVFYITYSRVIAPHVLW